MADIKLGPQGSEVTLPQICWRGENAPELTVDFTLPYEESTMCDGSKKYAHKGADEKRRFGYLWAGLTKTEKDIIETRVKDKQKQRLQDNWESTTWYEVIIAGFSYKKDTSTFHTGTVRYIVSLNLQEI